MLLSTGRERRCTPVVGPIGSEKGIVNLPVQISISRLTEGEQ